MKLTPISRIPGLKCWGFKDENGTEYKFYSRASARKYRKEMLEEAAAQPSPIPTSTEA